MKLTNEVPVGLGSVLGILGTAAAAVTCLVQSVSENQALLNGQNKPAGVIAFSLAMLTGLGRMYQAAQKK